ncbi:MAG: hypothetical protein J0L84_20155 [Verrucomicrobia bacterium]|nr:hypothetical protein [Verrucomicrobiota bacterium]
MSELLDIKGIAYALRRSRRYVDSMKRIGFPMPGGRATLADALAFLAEHPHPLVEERELVAVQNGSNLFKPRRSQTLSVGASIQVSQ